jgi:hypothetical protein
MQSVYLQRIMKKNADMGYEKTNPKQTQSDPILSAVGGFKMGKRQLTGKVCLLAK